MCTTISHSAAISGCGKGPRGWFDLDRVHVGYDHPYRAPVEHAVNLDFVDASAGTRLAVELTRESARELVAQVLATLDEADAYEQAGVGEQATQSPQVWYPERGRLRG